MISRQNPKIFIVKFLITCFFIFMTSAGFGVSNQVGIYVLYFTPIILVPLLLMMCCDIKGDENDNTIVYIITFVLSFVTFPVFLGVFFGVFHPSQSLNYEKVENCQVIGVAPMSQASLERYSILYVDFEYDSQNFLGYACRSNKGYPLYDYNFLDSDTIIPCDEVGSSYDSTDDRRVLELNNDKSYIEQRKRVLRERGGCVSRGKSGITSTYNFSNTKIPSWLCVEEEIEFDDLIRPKTCYINFYKDKEKGFSNSKERRNLKNLNHFAVTIFQYPPYFPKDALFCLIIFTYLPFLLCYYPLSCVITEIIITLIEKAYYKKIADI